MDAIWNYLEKNPVLLIVLLLAVAYLFSRLTSVGKGEVKPEDLVPHYKRFERREPELGDRRKAKMDAEAKAKAEAEQRKIVRRSND
ncbi:MAG: hypothetical protein V4709_15895 [Pseudomonadota bacterium]